MSVIVEADRLCLSGRCGVEDAEALLAAIRANPAQTLDLADCQALHTSILQVLLVSGIQIGAEPVDPALRRWLIPLLAAQGHAFSLIPPGL